MTTAQALEQLEVRAAKLRIRETIETDPAKKRELRKERMAAEERVNLFQRWFAHRVETADSRKLEPDYTVDIPE